jgi:heptosyltransferase-3
MDAFRYFALRDARREARLTVAAIRRLKAAHPGRRSYGIFLTEHLGDIIACEPVIGWLRARDPAALVVWVTSSRYAELLRDHPHLDALFTVESLGAIAPIIRSRVFDSAIDLHINRKPIGVANALHVKSWGDPSVDWNTYQREGSLLRALTKAGGIEQFAAGPTLYASASAKAKVDALDLPSRFVAVHLASNDPARDWTVPAWNRLIDYVTRECGLPLVEVGLESKLTQRLENVESVAGALSIMETAEVVRRAAFFIGIDSGPAHMANAWRTPSLILLGKFRGFDWCPYEGYFRERAADRLLRHSEAVSRLAADAVIDRLAVVDEWRALCGR